MTPVTWMLIALVAAFVAMAVSGLGRGGRGAGQFIADLRSWVRREPDPTGIGAFSEARRDLVEAAEVDEGGVADIFDMGERPERAYIEPSAERLVRVTQRAVESLSSLTHR